MKNIPLYAQVCGILGLIIAIAGFLIPIVGVLFITPIGIVLGAIALYGGYRNIGIAILIISAVKLLISPTFWAYLGGAAMTKGTQGYLAYFVGIIVMIFLAVRVSDEKGISLVTDS